MAEQRYVVIRKAIIDTDRSMEILAEKPYSTHPSDWYLRIILARIPSGWQNFLDGDKFVTWTENKDCGGFAHGHYFSSFEEALRDFNKRGSEQPIPE